MRMSGLALALVWKVTMFFHSCVKLAAITPFPLPETCGISHLPVSRGVQPTVTSGTQVCLSTISSSSGCRISAAHEMFSLFKHLRAAALEALGKLCLDETSGLPFLSGSQGSSQKLLCLWNVQYRWTWLYFPHLLTREGNLGQFPITSVSLNECKPVAQN